VAVSAEIHHFAFYENRKLIAAGPVIARVELIRLSGEYFTDRGCNYKTPVRIYIIFDTPILMLLQVLHRNACRAGHLTAYLLTLSMSSCGTDEARAGQAGCQQACALFQDVKCELLAAFEFIRAVEVPIAIASASSFVASTNFFASAGR